MAEPRPYDVLANLEIQRSPSYAVREFFQSHREKLGLRLLTDESTLDTLIRESTINRPGLALAGYTDVYTWHRIQILGSTDWSFLESLPTERRREVFERLARFQTPLWVITHNLPPHDEMIEMCKAHGMPLMVSTLSTLKCVEQTQNILEEIFAPTATIHASLVDVYGVGMLYTGPSNIGKSECVLDLVERGHRLVADDAVKMVRLKDAIIGASNHVIQHHMEVRGVGLIDVRSLFGIHAVSRAKKIDLVVELQAWRQGEDYQRTGLDRLEVDVMGIPVRKVVIPISPGKNITVISEVVAMDALLRRNGVDTAIEFNKRLQSLAMDPELKRRSEREYYLGLFRRWYD